jgi:GNAT superfamily N-acetyltransferase
MFDPLPPDIRFERLLPNPEDLAFSFAAKKEALGPHIRARWPWDEDYQSQIHRVRFAEKPFFRIWRQSDAVRTLSWLIGDDHARFGEFYLFPQYQGAGLGTRILRHALTVADERQLSVRLEYLKWNPVGSLYLRNGFVRTHETDIHVFLERRANRTRER